MRAGGASEVQQHAPTLAGSAVCGRDLGRGGAGGSSGMRLNASEEKIKKKDHLC